MVLQIQPAQGIHHRRCIFHQQLPTDQARQHEGNADVKNCGDDQRGDDADGNIALRILAFLRRGGNGVEANIGEENDGAARQHARPSVGIKRMPVGGVDELRAKDDEQQYGADFEQHHDVVGFRRLANAADQNHRQQHHDQKRGHIETEMPAGG